MTGYMMRKEDATNRFRLLVRVYGKAKGRQENASTACERFIQSAALLPEGEYLGWQMAVHGEEAISNMVFSSQEVKIQAEDFAWIFEKYAAVKPCEPDAQVADPFAEGRKVYAFACRPGEEAEKKNKDSEYCYDYNYGYEYAARKEHFENLLEMLQEAGGAYLRVIAGAASGSASGAGMLLLSLPGEISLRMRTVLSLAFPDTVVREVKVSQIGALENIPVSGLLEGIVGLQQAFIRCKGRKAGMAGKTGTENSARIDDRSGMENGACINNKNGTEDRADEEQYNEEGYDEGQIDMTDEEESDDWELVPINEEEYDEEYQYEDYGDEDYEDDDACLDTDSLDVPEEEDGLEYVPYTSIDTLNLSVRAYNCLKRAGVDSVEELRRMSDEELKGVRNLAPKLREEIKRVLAAEAAPAKDAPQAPVDYRAMLDELIGLTDVKEQVKKIEAYARMKQDMEASGNKTAQMVLNMEFVGNPGTAKTTVARILAGIFHEMGLLSTEEIIEVGRTDLVGLYIGHTADQVRNVFRKAKGRLLFIDEAYSLSDDRKGSFGDEAINTIVQEMENHRQETIVIFAGYRNEMEEFFSRNPGLRSRTPFKIEFGDYSPEEMERIVELEAGKRGFTLQEQAKDKVADICGDSKSAENAGNGRFCRNLLEKAILNYAFRVYGHESTETDRDCVLTDADFTAEGLLETKKETAPLGFRVRE